MRGKCALSLDPFRVRTKEYRRTKSCGSECSHFSIRLSDAQPSTRAWYYSDDSRKTGLCEICAARSQVIARDRISNGEALRDTDPSGCRLAHQISPQALHFCTPGRNEVTQNGEFGPRNRPDVRWGICEIFPPPPRSGQRGGATQQLNPMRRCASDGADDVLRRRRNANPCHIAGFRTLVGRGKAI